MPTTEAAVLPSDPIDRSQHRWFGLFFGLIGAIQKHDRPLADGIMLAFQQARLASWGEGDVLSFHPGLFEMNPSDEILKLTRQFFESAAIPSTRGRRKSDRLRPAYKWILMTYYRFFWEENQRPRETLSRGSGTAHERALRRTKDECRLHSTEACRKHVEAARKLFPRDVALWKGRGAEWVVSD